MSKNPIDNYLHFHWMAPVSYDCTYLGGNNLTGEITPVFMMNNKVGAFANVKPILRPKSSMTNVEWHEFLEVTCGTTEVKMNCTFEEWCQGEVSCYSYTPEEFAWLLLNRFDVFGLIDQGLAKPMKTANGEADGSARLHPSFNKGKEVKDGK